MEWAFPLAVDCHREFTMTPSGGLTWRVSTGSSGGETPGVFYEGQSSEVVIPCCHICGPSPLVEAVRQSDHDMKHIDSVGWWLLAG